MTESARAEPLLDGPSLTLRDLEARYGCCVGIVLGYEEGEFGMDGRMRWCTAVLPRDRMSSFVHKRRADGRSGPFLLAMGSFKRAEEHGGIGNALYGFGLAADAVLPANELLHADQLARPENLRDDGSFRWPNGVPFLRIWLCRPPRKFEAITGISVVFGQNHGTRVVGLDEMPGGFHTAVLDDEVREAVLHRPKPLPNGLEPTPRFREGGLRLRLLNHRERDPEARRHALRANLVQFGAYTCEECRYQPGHDSRVPHRFAQSMLDVHHVEPLKGGERDTTLAGLAVLCPLCHRRHHITERRAEAGH